MDQDPESLTRYFCPALDDFYPARKFQSKTNIFSSENKDLHKN